MSADPAETESQLTFHPDRRWCAIHTRARHEKKIALACQALVVPCYLPLRTNRTYSGGKTNVFEVPIFPGYVFAALGAGDLTTLKRTNSVAQKLEPKDEGGLLHDLMNVRAVERARVELWSAPRFEPGDPVRVIVGPLRGVTGDVVRHKNRTRLQIRVHTIQQAILVDVAKSDLEPLQTE